MPLEIFFNIISRAIAFANAEFTVRARGKSNPSEYQSLDMETLLVLLVIYRETNFTVKQLIRSPEPVVRFTATPSRFHWYETVESLTVSGGAMKLFPENMGVPCMRPKTKGSKGNWIFPELENVTAELVHHEKGDWHILTTPNQRRLLAVYAIRRMVGKLGGEFGIIGTDPSDTRRLIRNTFAFAPRRSFETRATLES